MIIINNMKYACERCIRGHRASTCNHRDAKLIMIKPKGRPSTQCPHCKELRKLKNSHVACNCSQKHNPSAKIHDKDCACIITGECGCCANKSKKKITSSTFRLSASPPVESPLSFDPNTATFISSIDSPSSGAPNGSTPDLYTDSYENLPSPSTSLSAMSPDQVIDYITGGKDSPAMVDEPASIDEHVHLSSSAARQESMRNDPNLNDALAGKIPISNTSTVNIPAEKSPHGVSLQKKQEESASDVVGGQLFEDFLSRSGTQTLEDYIKQQSGDDLLKSLGFDDDLKEVSREDEMQQMLQHLGSSATKTFM
ncbi:DEBR0S6_07184g1_1 [Brettanomyces bruxellensis]|uniref:DEBR0S6_07184g1_1 n=1 Tax=Dekkera bruxellensis TaxID=5007 RepID=A0A7D9H448_DEKBR|nr:DEBR0S6_07184g1_1 [Brettanomyces bruxellensis]